MSRHLRSVAALETLRRRPAKNAAPAGREAIDEAIEQLENLIDTAVTRGLGDEPDQAGALLAPDQADAALELLDELWCTLDAPPASVRAAA